MSTLNDFNTITTPMLERHLAVLQLKHYLHVQKSAIDNGCVEEFRRASNNIDKLTAEYGVGALHEAQDELL